LDFVAVVEDHLAAPRAAEGPFEMEVGLEYAVW